MLKLSNQLTESHIKKKKILLIYIFLNITHLDKKSIPSSNLCQNKSLKESMYEMIRFLSYIVAFVI